MRERPVGIFQLALSAAMVLLLGCGGTVPSISNARQLGEVTQETLQSVVDRNDAPGISYIVIDERGVVFEGHAGSADVADDNPVGPDTLYMACSTTKAITAITVMALVDEGVMDVDAPLGDYVEHPYDPSMTVAMALAHTGGVPAPAPLDWFFVEGEKLDHSGAYERVIADNPKAAGPAGKKYRYSNLSYWLVERAIENAAGDEYSEVVQSRVFAPLGLDAGDATFALPNENLATGHSRKWAFTNAIFYLIAPSRYWGTASQGWSRFKRLVHHGAAYGGLYTTANALAVVLQDLLREEPRVIRPASRATMFAPRKTTDGEDVGGGLGWVIGELNGHRYYGKQGGAIGFHGNVRVYPDLGIATVFLANSTRVSPGPIDALSDELDAPTLQYQSSR